MSAVLPWIVALVITLIIGGATTFYIRTILLRRNETRAGIAALSAMSYGEFIRLVLDAMQSQGYETITDPDAPSRNGEYLLAKDGRRVLMSCKHGSAFVLGPNAVSDMSSDLKLTSASGGMIVTQGRVGKDAWGPAKLMKIELLDGPILWPQVRGQLPQEKRDAISGSAGQDVRKHVLLGWLGAVVVGVLALLLMPEPFSAPTASGDTSLAAAAQTSVTVPGPEAVPVATEQGSVAAADEMADAAALAQQREDVARTINTLPMVARATWPTNSTLEVVLLETDSDAIASICPLIERYAALASSRIQLTPPEGSAAPVRFRQCRMY